MVGQQRKYEAIWKQLKNNPSATCVIKVVHPAAVQRIKKGVIKEKWRDEGFKVLNDIEHLFLKIEFDQNSLTLSFTLKSKFNLTEVVT